MKSSEDKLSRIWAQNFIANSIFSYLISVMLKTVFTSFSLERKISWIITRKLQLRQRSGVSLQDLIQKVITARM